MSLKLKSKLRTRIRLWENLLDGYEPTKDVLEWLDHGVDVKNSLSPLRDHLWVSSLRAQNARLEFLRTTILANNFRSCYENNSATYRVRSDPCLG